MDTKTLEMLEYPHIRDMVASYAGFSGGRQLAVSLHPSEDIEQINIWLNQAAEARRLLDEGNGYSISDIVDIREKVHLAELDGTLDPLSLLDIQHTLAALADIRSYLKPFSSDVPLIWQIAENIAPLPDIEKNIAACIDPSGEVLDSASPALASIRRQLRDTRSQILEKLEHIIRSPHNERVLQEDIVTEREGRYVILVKSDNRHDIKGIVHDISNTGATVFLEPASTVGLGNAIRELVVEERHEVERILRMLSASVAACAPDIEVMMECAAELDVIMARARFGRSIKASIPAMVSSQYEQIGHSSYLKLVDARHPLLGATAVPFSVELGHDYDILVITGPNTGGKTVTLKTIGLLALMAQSGIPIPASPESHLPIFDAVFADIGDEQSIEQTLSTFSWHMGNIKRILRVATAHSLVLLDELGTSTDPAEGSALARAILRFLQRRGTMAVVTSHFSDLKAFAQSTTGMKNASLEFDPATLQPTYRLTLGIPGGSNAIATAARLGLPREIIDDARGLTAEGGHQLEDLLTSVMEEKKKLQSLSSEIEKERSLLQKKNAELEKELQRLQVEEQRTLRETRDNIVREAAELHRELRQATVEIRKQKSAEKLEESKTVLAHVRERLAGETWQPREVINTVANLDDDTIKTGDTVRLKEVGMIASVLSVSEETGEIEIQAGRTHMRIALDSVTKISKPGKTPPPIPVTYQTVRSAPRQLDLRGKRADEIEPLLDIYLNEAAQTNLEEVRIIHGIGTGTVRNIVRDYLISHPLARSFRTGERSEGGDGATIVRL